MRERELEEHVREYCTDLDIIYVHHGRSVQVVKGWVDDVLIGHRGVLFRELKTEDGTVSEAQGAVIGRLAMNGLDVQVWRPSDLDSGRIVAELCSISRLNIRPESLMRARVAMNRLNGSQKLTRGKN